MRRFVGVCFIASGGSPKDVPEAPEHFRNYVRDARERLREKQL